MASYRLTFGENDQLKFPNEAQLFHVIGYLSKAGMFQFKYERNKEQGARENEYRIHVYSTPANYPPELTNAHTAGNKYSILYRINCNDFVDLLVKFGFVIGQKNQDISAIRPNIPKHFLKDFDDGCNA